MKKLHKNQIVNFEAIDNFAGETYPVKGKVIGSAKKSRFLDMKEYGEVTDDDYIILSNKKFYLVNIYEVKQ